MSSPRPPELSKDEIRVIQDTLKQSDDRIVELQMIAGIDRHRTMNHFYHHLYQICVSVQRHYARLHACVVSLLRVQADFMLKQQGVTGTN